jgi:hypothetical protein
LRVDESGLPGDVGEGAVAIIAVEKDAAEAGYEQVRPTIIIVDADDGTHGEAGIAYPGFVRDVRESAVAVVVIESTASFFAGEGHVDGGRVGEVNIGKAVAVVVDKSNAASHGLDDVFLFG